jgi:hypothetical protein
VGSAPKAVAAALIAHAHTIPIADLTAQTVAVASACGHTNLILTRAAAGAISIAFAVIGAHAASTVASFTAESICRTISVRATIGSYSVATSAHERTQAKKRHKENAPVSKTHVTFFARDPHWLHPQSARDPSHRFAKTPHEVPATLKSGSSFQPS